MPLKRDFSELWVIWGGNGRTQEGLWLSRVFISLGPYTVLRG